MSNNDVLSDIFSNLRLASGLYFRANLGCDASIELPEERRRIRFHLVRRGQCWVNLHDEAPEALVEGDLAIVPNGVGQIITASPDAAPQPLPEILSTGALSDGVLTYGDGDRRVDLLCGFCHVDEDIDHPLLANLPPLMILRPGDLGAEPWAIAALRLLAMEADLDTQGSTGILSRLLEIVFVQAVRRTASAQAVPATGFIAALTDTRLTKALQAIHTQPGKPWSVSDLAARAGPGRASPTDSTPSSVNRQLPI
jgi:hypothetical protein